MNGAAAPAGPAIPPTATFARELEVAAHVRESFETAAAPSAALAVPGAGSAAPAVADGASRRPRMADLLEAGLREAGMSPELAAEVIGEAVSHGMPFASPRAIKRLARWALTRRLPASSVRAPGGLTMAFVGPSGSGKTLCTARLAVAYAHGSDLPVVCLSLRPRDGGAELADLVRPHGVQVQVVEETSEAFATALAAVAERALVVIDTPAINPRSAEDLDRLAGELRAIGLTETHLVLPATFSAAAAREQLGRLEPLGISRLAVTRTDETDHLGPVAELAIATGLPLSYVTSSDEVLGGMTPADPHQLAVRLLP
jgi:hypothetical protein